MTAERTMPLIDDRRICPDCGHSALRHTQGGMCDAALDDLRALLEDTVAATGQTPTAALTALAETLEARKVPA